MYRSGLTRWALLLLALPAMYCGGGDGSLGESPRLSGRIENWPPGQVSTLTASISTHAEERLPIASGTIDSNGMFTISLPEDGEFRRHLSSFRGSCKKEPAVEPATLRTTGLYLSVDGLPGQALAQSDGDPFVDDSASVIVDYVYSDADGSVTGKYDCGLSQDTIETEYDWSLRRGWNSVLSRVRDRSAPGERPFVFLESSTSGPPPRNVTWWRWH